MNIKMEAWAQFHAGEKFKGIFLQITFYGNRIAGEACQNLFQCGKSVYVLKSFMKPIFRELRVESSSLSPPATQSGLLGCKEVEGEGGGVTKTIFLPLS